MGQILNPGAWGRSPVAQVLMREGGASRTKLQALQHPQDWEEQHSAR